MSETWHCLRCDQFHSNQICQCPHRSDVDSLPPPSTSTETSSPTPKQSLTDALKWSALQANADALANLTGMPLSACWPIVLTANDKLGTNVIDRLVLRAKKQIGDVNSGKPVRMEPVRVDGGKHFIYLACPESMYDIRREVGDAGWLTLEKAKITAEGSKSVLYTGGRALYNSALIDETQTCVKFDNTTPGGSYGTPLVARNMFLGANAVAVAHGTKAQRDGMKYELSEADEDYGEEGVVIVRMIAGFSKCRFSPDGVPANGLDFGLIVNDVAYTASA